MTEAMTTKMTTMVLLYGAFDNQQANEAIVSRGWREERPTASCIHA
jgi:hypothetical protein